MLLLLLKTIFGSRNFDHFAYTHTFVNPYSLLSLVDRLSLGEQYIVALGKRSTVALSPLHALLT